MSGLTGSSDPGTGDGGPDQAHRCSIVPPYLLRALAAHPDERLAECAQRSLARDHQLREARAARPRHTGTTEVPGPAAGVAAASPQRTISDAHAQETTPGTRVRGEGDAATGDAAADEAYDGFGQTWDLYYDVYGRDSVDGRGLPLLGTVHYGRDYDNAFWDGTQMVFGDGDGTVFTRFTIAVDVMGHELTHGVTEHTAGLAYQGQAGALNESVSDVFGSLVKQRGLGQTAAQADWLIGEGLFTPSVQGVALRSMKAPGTAYDDPQLGKDPQPATMAGYVETTDDNGGVHINSGIPNHAFYLAATAIGGQAWEGAGHVWFDVLTGGSLPADCDFATFAEATLHAAEQRFGAGTAEHVAVQDAWTQVGVLSRATPAQPSAGGGQPAGPTGPAGPGGSTGTTGPTQQAGGQAFRLRRTGGLAGRARERTVALAELPDDDAATWRDLLDGNRLGTIATAGRTIPDAFTYHVACPPEGDEVALAEHDLPAEVRELLARTLDL